MSGVLALVGGGEFGAECQFDSDLLQAADGAEVVIVPTAAAYEHPERAVAAGVEHFERLGGKARGLMVLNRHDALDDAFAAEVRAARFVYLVGGSPMHLRSVLKATPLWDALRAAYEDGAVIAGSSAGAMALCDPMVDPRGGAFTLGLGLLQQAAVIPHHDQWSHDRSRRTFELAGSAFPILAIDEQTAAIRSSDGTWRTAGSGTAQVMLDGHEVDLTALP